MKPTDQSLPDVAGRNSTRPALVADGGVDLLELWAVIWRGKWRVILGAALFGALGATYALTATKWYRAEVLLIPVENRSQDALVSQLGGLASMVGINVGSADAAEPLAVLSSRDFARRFIEDHDLLPVLYADRWEAASKSWKGDESEWPDIRDAVTMFDERVRRITEDRRTGLVSLAIDWKDPELAARWAKQIPNELNSRMSERAIAQAERNIDYLRTEMEATSLVQLQQPIGRLLEIEFQKLMLAKNSDEYAYRVVDEAETPRRPIRPQRALIVAIAVILGGTLALSWLILGNIVAARTAASTDD